MRENKTKIYYFKKENVMDLMVMMGTVLVLM